MRKAKNHLGMPVTIQVRKILDSSEPIYEAVVAKCSSDDRGTIEKVRLTSPGDWHNAVLVKSQFRRVKQ